MLHNWGVSMHECTGWQSTKTRLPCTVICTPLFNNHPYISSSDTTWARFLYRNLFLETCFWSAHVCALMNGVQQPVRSASSVFPARNRKWYISPGYAQFKAKLKLTIPRQFCDYWWLFWTLHVSCYGARLAEERMNNSDFRLFQVCHLKIANTRCYYYCRLGQAL